MKLMIKLAALAFGAYVAWTLFWAFLYASLWVQLPVIGIALGVYYARRRLRGKEDGGPVFKALGWCASSLASFGTLLASNRWGQIGGGIVAVLLLADMSWGADAVGFPVIGWTYATLGALCVGGGFYAKRRIYEYRVKESLRAIVPGHTRAHPPKVAFGEVAKLGFVGRLQPVGKFSFEVPAEMTQDKEDDVEIRLRQRLPAANGSTWGFDWDLREWRCRARVIPDLPRLVWHPASNGSCGNPLAPIGDPFRIAVGITHGGEIIYWEPREVPHGFIVGATGGGKSVLLRRFMQHCFLFSEYWALYILDLKRTEFTEWARYPGVVEAVGKTHAEALYVMEAAWEEMNRRQTLLDETGAEDLEQLNEILMARGQARLRRVLIIMDEVGVLLAQVSGNSEEMKERKAIRDAILLKMAEIAMLGRAMGVHLMYATQRTNKDLIPMDIRMNSQMRFGLGKLDSAQSLTVFESNIADKMRGGKGRGIASIDGALAEIQTYNVTKDQLRDMAGVNG